MAGHFAPKWVVTFPETIGHFGPAYTRTKEATGPTYVERLKEWLKGTPWLTPVA